MGDMADWISDNGQLADLDGEDGMDDEVTLLSVDPGMAHFGIAVVHLESQAVPYLDVIATKPSSRKRKILVSDDNTRRLREIYDHLWWVIDKYQPDALCCETFSPPRHASAAVKAAMSWTLLVTIDLPFVQASPQEIKKKMTGLRNASKEDVAKAVRKWACEPLAMGKIAAAKREHAYDAIAAAVTCADSEIVRAIRRARR